MLDGRNTVARSDPRRRLSFQFIGTTLRVGKPDSVRAGPFEVHRKSDERPTDGEAYMLAPSRTLFLTFLLLAPTFACGGAVRLRTGSSGVPGNNAGSGIVFSGPDMQEHGGTLLAFLSPRISGMVVDFRSQPYPGIQMRGQKSLFGSSAPVVYTDGARTANSCALQMLSTRDIMSVEVYPMGLSHRPGYAAHPNGLILVFMDDGSVPEGSN